MELREKDGNDPGSEGLGECAGIDCNSVGMAFVLLYFLRMMMKPTTRTVTRTAIPIVTAT